MKKVFLVVIILLTAIVFCIDFAPMASKAMALPKAKDIKVLLAYHPDYLKQAPHILAAYESVLQEEGVPFERVDVFQLVTCNTDRLVEEVPVVILPDNLLQNVPEQFSEWINKYLGKGGNVTVVYDVGVKNENGFYLDRSALADTVGLNYVTYGKLGATAYDLGHLKYSSEASCDFFQIPMGKTADGLMLSSYTYGPLQYPIAKNEPLRDIPKGAIFAYGVTETKEEYPAIVLTDYEKGKVLYVNLPLGYMKAYSDDLPLRSILRTFLFDVVAIPHVMNVEQGRGGICFNWHVDADIEHISTPYLLKKGYFRKNIPVSIHVTAGDFFLKPHDNTGFDAAGPGRRLVLQLKDYGVIGSHGGWAHNWFSNNIDKGVFKEKEIREYIQKNNECLEKITGQKVIEYAAPNGVHPQPVATKALEELGMIAYYYTGDTGSAPNRTFYGGEFISDKVIAFPIMPFGRAGSIYEMKAVEKKSESEVEQWFTDTLNFVASNRTVRLIYSHPYDIQHYPQAIWKFFDKVEAMQANREITVHPMSEYAKFFLRFLKTTYTFSTEGKQLIVSLKNPEALTGITIALPKQTYQRPPADDGIMVQEDQRYYYLTVVGQDEKEKTITVDIN